MKYIFTLGLSLVYYSCHSYSYFECQEIPVNIERAFCESEDLRDLENTLQHHYSKLLQSLKVNDYDYLVTSQNAWQRSYQKECESDTNTSHCLRIKLQVRIRELEALSSNYSYFPELSDLDSMCKEIAALSSKQRIIFGDFDLPRQHKKYVKLFDINNDGRIEKTRYCVGGTMRAPCVEYFSENDEVIYPYTQGYEWKTYWTFGQYTFRYQGKWFTLHSYDDYHEQPAYVSYLTPKNEQYVLCEFQNTEINRFIPNSFVQDAEQICLAVKNQDSNLIKNVSLTDEPTMTYKIIQEQGRFQTGVFRQGLLDYNNDGILNDVVELDYASGAGRGCDFNYFDEIENNKVDFKDNEYTNLLHKMQKIRLDAFHPNCGSSTRGEYVNRFFSFEDKNYYEHNTLAERAIYILNNNKINTVCRVEKSYESQLTKIGISMHPDWLH